MLNADFQFVYLYSLPSLITSHFMSSPIVNCSKDNGGGGDDPSDDPSSTHTKDHYGYFKMVDLREHDTSDQYNIEMGVYAVNIKSVFDVIEKLKDMDNPPLSDSDLDKFNYPYCSKDEVDDGRVKNDKRPIQIKATQESSSWIDDKSLAYKYCNALSMYWGLTPYYTESYDGTPVTHSSDDDAFYGVRLPTNEEWVFAANSGIDDRLFSGPKWVKSDINFGVSGKENMFMNTGSNPHGYGDHSKYTNYFNLTCHLLPETTDIETAEDGKPIYCYPKNPQTTEIILNIINDFNSDNYGTYVQNFGLPYLGDYAWTKYSLYRDDNNPIIFPDDVPMYILPQIYVSGNKNSPVWVYDESKRWDYFKIGDNVYKSNINGWANRLSSTGGLYGTHDVDSLNANDWGFKNMTGNVAELVVNNDGSTAYKGGSFASNPQKGYNYVPTTLNDAKGIVGFRVCRNIKPKE